MESRESLGFIPSSIIPFFYESNTNRWQILFWYLLQQVRGREIQMNVAAYEALSMQLCHSASSFLIIGGKFPLI